MATTEEWKTPEKRRTVITQLEDALRSRPGTPPQHFKNPVEIENTIFERAKSQDEYQRTIHNLILKLIKSGQPQVAPQPAQNQLPTHPGMSSHVPAAAMTGRPPGYQNYQPPGMPHMQHSMVPQPQPQPPQYNLNMNPTHPNMGMAVPPHSQQRSIAPMPHPQVGPTSFHPSQPPPHMAPANTYHPGPTQMPGGGYHGVPGGVPPRYTPSPAQSAMTIPAQMQANMMAAAQRQAVHSSMIPGGVGIPATSQIGMQQPGMPGIRQALPPQYPSQPAGNFLDNSVQSVKAVPNPSFSMPGGTKVSPAPPTLSYHSNPASSAGVQLPPKGTGQVTGVPSPYSSAVGSSPGPAPTPTPVSTAANTGQEATHTTQAQPQTVTTVANPSTPHLPSMPVPSPAPATPLLPASPATSVGSPAPSMTPEENEAYLRKLGELQRYAPLLQRMLTRLSNSEDKKRGDQYMKLRSLYNLLQDTNRRVPMQTLWKCSQALEKMFEPKGKEGDQDLLTQFQPPSTSSIATPTSTPKDAPPLPPHPIPEPPKSQASLKEFKIIPSPPPTASNLLATVPGQPFSVDRLPSAKRLCNREEPTVSPGLMRELAQLEHFKIQRLPQPSRFDKSTMLECSLVDDGLPHVPSLRIRIPPNYPIVSPECDLSHYTGTSFLKDVGNMLSERLSRSNAGYTLSSLLTSWESCVLQATAKELSDEDDY